MRPTRSEASRTGGGRGCGIGTVAELMHLLSFLIWKAAIHIETQRNLPRDFVAPPKGLPFSGLMLRRFGSHIAIFLRRVRSPSQSQATKPLSARPTINHNRAAHPEKSKEFFLPPFYLRSKKRRSAVGPRPDGFARLLSLPTGERRYLLPPLMGGRPGWG